MKLKTEVITIDNLHSNMFVDFLNIDSDYVNNSDISKKYNYTDKYNGNENY